MVCVVHMSVFVHTAVPCSILSSVSVFVVSPCPYGRTSVHAAASWHHRVESLLLHGHSALSITFSPAVTSWCELPVSCANVGLHTGVTRCSDFKLCVLPTGYTQCHQSTGSDGLHPKCHTDVMSATLAEAATQVSFAAFLKSCISVSASPPPPRPIPTPPLDAATQTLPHIAVSQDVPTQLSFEEFLAPPSARDVLCSTCSRPVPSLLLDAAVHTPLYSVASQDAFTQLPLTEFLIGCTLSNDPFDRQAFPSAHCNAR